MNYVETSWVAQSGFPLLGLLQLLPLVMAAVIILLRKTKWVFAVAVIGVVAEFLLTLGLYAGYDHSITAFQFAEQVQILGLLNYHAAADGMTVLFTLLVSFFTLIIVFYGRACSLGPAWQFLALIFAIEAALVSQFVTVDLLWFALVSVIQLVLVGYLLWKWSTSADQDLAFTRYLQFMGIGAILLFGSVIMLGWNYSDVTNGSWSFDLFELAKVPVRPEYQSVIFLLFLFGLGIRIPMFPLHGWLPVTMEHGTVAVAPVFLLGVKTGVYGLLRFVFPLLEEAVVRWHEFVVTIAVIGVFYAAVLALMQENLRRLLAYAVISHTGILVIGLFSLGHTAFQGGILLSVNFGLAIGVLLFMTGIVFRRTGTTLLGKLGGLFDRLPIIGTAFLIGGLSIIGMPGTPGFDSVHLVLEAAMERFGAVITIAAALGNVAAAGFLLWAFQRAFLAQGDESTTQIKLASTLERMIAVTVIAVLLVAGFYSGPWLELLDKSLEGISALYEETH